MYASTMHEYIYLLGTKRFDSEKAGDREVQRTMLELLNQLDGFHPSTDIKVSFYQSPVVLFMLCNICHVCFEFIFADQCEC